MHLRKLIFWEEIKQSVVTIKEIRISYENGQFLLVKLRSYTFVSCILCPLSSSGATVWNTWYWYSCLRQGTTNYREQSFAILNRPIYQCVGGGGVLVAWSSFKVVKSMLWHINYWNNNKIKYNVINSLFSKIEIQLYNSVGFTADL